MIKALLRTDVPGFTNSSISILMTFITAKFFQPIFFPARSMETLSSPRKTCSRMASALATNPLLPSSLPTYHEREPCGFPSGYSGSQLWAALVLQSWAWCFPLHKGNSVEDQYHCNADSGSWLTVHKDPLPETSLLHCLNTRLQPLKPSIRFLLLDQGAHHHHQLRSHQTTIAMTSPEQPHLTLKLTLLWARSCMRYLQGPSYLNCWRTTELG